MAQYRKSLKKIRYKSSTQVLPKKRVLSRKNDFSISSDLKNLFRQLGYKRVLILFLLSVMLFYIGYSLWSLGQYKSLSDDQVTQLVEKYSTGQSEDSENEEKVLFPDGENRLIVPKIGLDIGILDGDEDVLEKGMWHRYPERGDPLSGGNFILSGHRFSIGFGVGGLQRTSPLFNIDKLDVGDRLEVIWNHENFTYQVDEVLTVAPNAIEIESPTDTHILTMYSCTLRGANDGRVVIRAVLVE